MGHNSSWHAADVRFTATTIITIAAITYVHANVNVRTTPAEASLSSNATDVYPKNLDSHHIQRVNKNKITI